MKRVLMSLEDDRVFVTDDGREMNWLEFVGVQ
jgi:hypothetical protein